ncbi:hypothetical protein [Gluconacetobacter diazotrophicus]|nr:hypothetical protein [Gluconacetobacter diazotrophicus]
MSFRKEHNASLIFFMTGKGVPMFFDSSVARQFSYPEFLARNADMEGKRLEWLSKGPLEDQRTSFLRNDDHVVYELSRAACLAKHVEDSINELNRLDVSEGFSVERVQKRQSLGKFLVDVLDYHDAVRMYSWANGESHPGPEMHPDQIKQDRDYRIKATERLHFLQHV